VKFGATATDAERQPGNRLAAMKALFPEKVGPPMKEAAS
jgi:hypothetical protein